MFMMLVRVSDVTFEVLEGYWALFPWQTTSGNSEIVFRTFAESDDATNESFKK